MSIFDSRLFFLCPSLLFVLNTVLCATPFVVFIFFVFIPIGLCYLPLFPSFFPWLLIALWWFCLLLFHFALWGLRCDVSSPYNTAPRTVLPNGKKKTSYQKQRPSYILPQVFRVERAERFKYSELQHTNNKTKTAFFNPVRWITEEDGNKMQYVEKSLTSSTLTFEKHFRPMWHDRIGTGSASTWTLFWQLILIGRFHIELNFFHRCRRFHIPFCFIFGRVTSSRVNVL